jgi:hypothetical protein
MKDMTLDSLVASGVIKGYEYYSFADYGCEPRETLTLTFPNDETLRIGSRAGCDESSYLAFD